MTINLSGRSAVVTAGAAGIGLAIAEALAQAGARVAVCDVDANAVAAMESRGFLAVTANVGDELDMQHFFARVFEQFGGLDILVNNAGISGPTKSLEDITLAEWTDTMHVNVTGHFICARNVIPVFKRQRSGAIINISSTAGRMAMPLRGPYSASKYAVRGLTDVLAVELGEFNVRVNAILPGMVEGPRLSRVVAEQASRAGKSSQEYLDMMLHNVSMHSTVSAQEIAGTVAFLASDLARHISGQSISVCGNFESYRGPFVVKE